MCVNSLPRLALDSGVAGIWTHNLLITSPVPHHYATEPHHMEVYWSNSTRQTEDVASAFMHFQFICLSLSIGSTAEIHNRVF